jgi:hypothetical protein
MLVGTSMPNWAEIPGVPGFLASEDGEIKSPKGKILSQWQEANDGAWRVYARKRNRMVAYLVLTAFTGTPPNGKYYIRFVDKDKSNSRLENLAWKAKRS